MQDHYNHSSLELNPKAHNYMHSSGILEPILLGGCTDLARGVEPRDEDKDEDVFSIQILDL